MSKNLDKMSPQERESFLSEKVRGVIEYTFIHSSAFADRMAKSGLEPKHINGIKDLEKISVMTKEELLELQRQRPPFAGLLGLPLEQIGRIFISPGPLYEPEVRTKDYTEDAAVFRALGVIAGDIALNTLSYHLVPAGIVADESLRAAGVIVVPSGTGNPFLSKRR